MNDKLELNDISDELLIINKATIERLFQEENKDTLVLYMFYYKTAKWQNHNPIKATDDYTMKCLNWGDHKLKNIKKRLKEMELIEVEKRFNEKKQVNGWYIRINYYNSSSAISRSAISPLVAEQHHKILLDNNILNTNNNNNKKEIYKEKSFTKPTLDEVREYCLERNNNIDPETFIDFYESKGWSIGKSKMKDWRAAIRNWEHKSKPQKSKQQLIEEEILRKIEEEEKLEQERSNGLNAKD